MTSAKILKNGPYRKKRLKGLQEKGMSFERRVSKWLPKQFKFDKFYYDYWIKFEADGKVGWAQPDMWGVVGDTAILTEVKLSYNKTAIPQLTKLYLPLLRFLYPEHKILCTHVFRYNRARIDTILSIDTILTLPDWKQREVLLHQHIH